jgi:L-seryl-tRNA(Ser) seleniumtransferase
VTPGLDGAELPTVALSTLDEPLVAASVAAGADLTLFSGDKLLGGPQAGIAVGRTAIIQRLRHDPLMRALRPDKMTLAALEATLRLHRDPAALARRLPVYRMLTATAEQLERRAEKLAESLRAGLPELRIAVAADQSYAGGGTLPAVALPTWVVRVKHPALASEALAAALRRRETPVICRLHDGALVLDVRTLRDEEAEELLAAIVDSIRESS